MAPHILVIGGGAAGFFFAINVKEKLPQAQVTIWEKSNHLLEKVRISGGGRCNVTHHCFDPLLLSKNYPRGERELLSAFTRFQPQDTLTWFAQHGVEIYAESDGRMFPTTDNAETITQCFLQTAQHLNIAIKIHTEADTLTRENGKWKITSAKGETLSADVVMVATGPSLRFWQLLKKIGHDIVPPVPSLFTFNVKDPRLQGLMGLSVPLAQLHIPDYKLNTTGPLLITHWGVSGPAVLRLSAWGARVLHEKNYRFPLFVNFCGESTKQEVVEKLLAYKTANPRRVIVNHPLFNIPKRLWERLAPSSKRWADNNRKEIEQLAENLVYARFQVTGKSTFKEEFVTSGGVALPQINFKTFESKLAENLFLAGEVLDIDALTGGFNFQAAWTGAWLAANAVAERF